MPHRRKQRLLFLCQNVPYPPHGGAAIRSYHTLRALGEAFDVTALCFHRSATATDRLDLEDRLLALAQSASVEAFPIPQENNKARLITDHVQSVLTQSVYTRWTYDSRQVKQRLASLLDSRSFEAVHVDSLDLSAYLGLVPRPVGLAHHNVESQLLRRRAIGVPGLKGRYLRLQARLMAKEERRWASCVSVNMVVSNEDAVSLQSIAPRARCEVIPNGVDTEAFRPGYVPIKPESIVFVGGWTWFPNRDGMEFFAAEVLPEIRKHHPNAEITWVGRAPENVRAEYAAQGITMTGYVDDIRPYVDPAACFIVPLRVGGGTRLKILDAWALGKAVVSTSQGAEGLTRLHRENIMIADSPRDFAHAVSEVIKDPQLRGHLAAGGRRTVEQSYDWGVIGDKLVELYGDAVRDTTRLS